MTLKTTEQLSHNPDEVSESVQIPIDMAVPALESGVESIEISRLSVLETIANQFIKEREMMQRLGLRSKATILCGAEGIENQEISFIDNLDAGKITACLKLTAEQYKTVKARIQEIEQNDEFPIEASAITYASADKSVTISISKAYTITSDAIAVNIANPIETKQLIGTEGAPLQQVKIAEGLVTIDIPYVKDDDEGNIYLEDKLNEVLIKVLGIKEGLVPPSPEQEQHYKEKIYRWHHKISTDDVISPEQSREIDQLQRREVFPSYYTEIATGKHLEYQEKYGEYAIYRYGLTRDKILRDLGFGGIMSVHERLKRGYVKDNSSATFDLQSGGADGVFTRTVLEGSELIMEYDKLLIDEIHDYLYIFSPELFDRTDWYAYESDRFGSTESDDLQNRQSPSDLFQAQKTNGFNGTNEQIFRTGISSRDIKAIACVEDPEFIKTLVFHLELNSDDVRSIINEGPDVLRAALIKRMPYNEQAIEKLIDLDKRMLLIKKLHEAGIYEVNGVIVEQFVVSAHTVDDFIDITNGRPIRSRVKNDN
jgi:hypothetical protein